MELRRALFGPNQAEIWRQLSTQIGGEYVPGSALHEDRLVAHSQEWTITLDTYPQAVGRAVVTYTRIRAPYVNRDGFRFRIHKKNLLSDLGKRLGMQDIVVGDPAFDDVFIIQGTDEAKAKALFAGAPLRQLLQQEPDISLEVRDDEGWFGTHFPEGVDELCLQVVGGVKDVARLKRMYDLFAETLDQLCRIGSAYEQAPPVKLSP
jgi:hypothetical protein